MWSRIVPFGVQKLVGVQFSVCKWALLVSLALITSYLSSVVVVILTFFFIF